MLLTTSQGGLHVWIQSNNTLLIKYYYNTTPAVQLSYKVMSAGMSLASFMRATHEHDACHLHVTKLCVRSATVYFCSSFSLQVTSELANSRRS